MDQPSRPHGRPYRVPNDAHSRYVQFTGQHPLLRSLNPRPYWVAAVLQSFACWAVYFFGDWSPMGFAVIAGTAPLTLLIFMHATVGRPVTMGYVRRADVAFRLSLGLSAVATLTFLSAVLTLQRDFKMVSLVAALLSTMATVSIIVLERRREDHGSA